ncbi:uncharacterized protein VTP21DRAFT_6921 [Calcarisporiella thermophila]|uniref:uncharacterized protein n=1 Tax=Calcarisporiella thermophila TaxID=911321 RepID=UPI003742437E
MSKALCLLLFAVICAVLSFHAVMAHPYKRHPDSPDSEVHTNSTGPLKLPNARPPRGKRKFSSDAIEKVIANMTKRMADKDLAMMFQNCFPNTLDTTIAWHKDSGNVPLTFVITGDIPAMWLRDSTNQVLPYIPYAPEDPALQRLILGVINMQAEQILSYPYGNAFRPPKEAQIKFQTNKWAQSDQVYPPYDASVVWEAKYELDSLASFLRLSYRYFNATGDASFTKNPKWLEAAKLVVMTMRVQQKGTFEELNHSAYNFTRLTRTTTETLSLNGIGNPVSQCGLIKSHFRPSDDSSIFPFLIPANAMAAVGLDQLAEILNAKDLAQELSKDARELSKQVRKAIDKYGIVTHPEFGRMYAYEVDGYGSHLLMDDANIPSLLSLPSLGFVKKDDPVYLTTRRFILSNWNPYYARGKYPGIGSPHTGLQRPWPLAFAMQALTSTSDEEIKRMLRTLRDTTGGTGLMHESFDVDNPSDFSRDWFAWANTVFGELLLEVANERPHLLFPNDTEEKDNSNEREKSEEPDNSS